MTKSQTSANRQIANPERFGNLGFGHWNLFGNWNLGFGHSRSAGFTPSLKNGTAPHVTCDTNPLSDNSEAFPVRTNSVAARERRAIFSAGFTVVEMVIIISILVLISAVLLANFPAFSQRAGLQRTSQQLALAMRKAQNMSFAARQTVRVGGGTSIPPYFGVYIGPVVGCPGEPGGYNYIIFADFHPPANPNRQYNCGRDPVVEKFNFEQGISLSDIVFTPRGGSAGSLDPDVIHITFSVPEARTGLLDRNNSEGRVAEVILAGVGTLTRKVTIRDTGQIYSR